MVCAARAAADGRIATERFADPTAMAFLPPNVRAEVERFRAGEAPRGLRERWTSGSLQARAQMLVVRTVAIDDAVRTAGAEQLVILGAGFDGRAWRMPELKMATVFEVDHPDSQRVKKERTTGLVQAAREVRFVPVDFTKDDLDRALEAAGHDSARPTTWIWEGVVMYLTPAAIEATLAVIARRSAPSSTLVIAYHAPAAMLLLIAPLVRAVGEPIRSVQTARRMRALLARYGFKVERDGDTPSLAAALSAELQNKTRMMKHLRIVVAARTAIR
jgi:methyltransferase (TIGR00027 family)